jgi:hypothetical protein
MYEFIRSFKINITGGLAVGIKLSELPDGSIITVNASNKVSTLTLNATIKKILNEDLALISLPPSETGQILNFDNVHIEIEYAPEDGIPFVWKSAQIVYYRSEYVLKTVGDGMRNNRRDCFRVGVGHSARMRMQGRGETEVLVRDISISGFALSDRKKDLNLSIGDKVSVYFEDIGFILDLIGHVVRTEEREDMTIYGFEITNICKDLSTYISVKQRRNSAK